MIERLNGRPLIVLGLLLLPCGVSFAGETDAGSTDRALSISGSYTIEALANISGGQRTGVAADGLFQIAMDLHPGKLFGWSGTTIHGGLLYAHGSSLTEKYLGDFGVASDIDAYDSVRLAEAWIEQTAFADRLSLRVGLLVADTEFCAGGMESSFINSSFGGPAAISANFALAGYPYNALGLRLRVRPARGWSVMFGAYDGNVAPGVFADPTPRAALSTEFNHWNTHLALRHDEGAMLFAEVGWQNGARDVSEGQVEPLVTSLKGGLVYHTDRFGAIGDSTSAALGFLDPLPENSGIRGNYALYFFADHELWREPGSTRDGLGAFAHATFTPPGRNFLQHSIEGGLIYRGLWQADAGDTAAIGVAWLGISPDVRRSYQAANAQSPEDEVTFELTYQRRLTKWCTLQPDLQYIIHPGGFADHGLVAGLRAVLSF